MLKIIKTEDIKEINKKFTSGVLLRDELDAIYSSCMYYDSKKEQICSIFLSLIKGHYFADGNKRTSVVVLLSLIKLNGMKTKINDENLFDMAVNTARLHLSVKQMVNIVF